MNAPITVPEWKQVVAEWVAGGSSEGLQLPFFGAANQIAGYRLYYMLQYAKQAGVRRLTLITDGLFWNDEASEWLIESGVDDIIVVTSRLPDSLSGRLAEFSSRRAAPPVRVQPPASPP